MAESLLGRQLSTQLSIDSGDGVGLELELLKNVYMKDLKLSRDSSGRVELLFHVTPSTGDDLSKKYTYLDLHFILPGQYPEEPARITIPTSRGVSDSHIKDVLSILDAKARTLSGSPMLFELVDYAKDSLTDNNIPCGDCVVCLLPFHESDEVTRTDCYHYFHVSCLSRYLNYFERQQQQDLADAIATGTPSNTHPTTAAGARATLTTHPSQQPKELECPVCRERIAPDAACLAQCTASEQLEEEGLMERRGISISQELRRWQRRMAELQQRQRERGGMIDVTAKDEVIDETWVRPVPSASDFPHTRPSKEDCRQTRPPNGTRHRYPCGDRAGSGVGSVQGKGRGRPHGDKTGKKRTCSSKPSLSSNQSQ